MFNYSKYRLIKKKRLLLFLISLLSSFTLVNGQAISVSGKITSSRFPVIDASVTFIDNADTTLQYSTLTDSRGSYTTDLITSIKSGDNRVPTKFILGQSYPNPFSSSTAIPYGLNEETNIQVSIYDVLGRAVRKFDVGQKSIGTHNLLWDGRNNVGNKVANGIYFYRFLINGKSQVRKMIFNQNGNGSFPIPSTFSLTENEPLVKENFAQNIQGTNFTIRLRNTSSTIPLLVEEDIENVVIQNDTTINFAVLSQSLATIDFDSSHQIIRGFGASNVILWRPDMTSSEVETAFGTDNGQIGFSILRIMLEADTNRWSLYLPSAKKAYEMGATIIASPWFAPDELSEDIGAINRVRHDKYAEYAEHLNAFIVYMENNGVSIYGISIQNEPDIEESWTSWTSSEMFTFMRDYAHAIEGAKVMSPESFHFDREYSDPILNDSVAAENTDILAGHIYGSGLAKYPLAKEKGKEVWMTEYLINSGNPPTNLSIDTGWVGAMQTAESINACMNADMSAYVWWNIIRYYGPIADGTYERKGEVAKKGYVMSQFSKYIRPGFYRVESKTSPLFSKVAVTAYKDPETSKTVIIAVNSNTDEVEQNFRIQGGELTTTYIPYTTSETKNIEQGGEVTVNTDNFKVTLDPLSITTFISE